MIQSTERKKANYICNSVGTTVRVQAPRPSVDRYGSRIEVEPLLLSETHHFYCGLRSPTLFLEKLNNTTIHNAQAHRRCS